MLGGLDLTPNLEDDGIIRFILGWLWLSGLFLFCWFIYMPYQFVMKKLRRK